MLKAIVILIGTIIGLVASYFYFNPQGIDLPSYEAEEILPEIALERSVIGFLPYWLLDKADKDYSPYIHTLAYFALTPEGDGSIQKFTNPGEAEPGWYSLQKGKGGRILSEAKSNNIKLSLVIFSGSEETIAELISEPEVHAQTMMDEVIPVMKKHQFTDLNIDIESVKLASEEARVNFTRFVSEVKKQMDSNQVGTLSIDASPTVFIKKYLVDPVAIAPLVDQFIIMGYDYHYQGSSVTGPVAPLGGADTISEFDTVTGIKLAMQVVSPDKLILAIPLYGYEWETLDSFNRAATIPGSGIAASNRRVEQLLKDCTTCRVSREKEGQEAYVVFKDEETGTYHQIFYPDKEATAVKVAFAKEQQLGGIALWALGYEGDSILEPLKDYK